MDKLYTKAEIETTDKGMLAVASTAVEDRHGEVVEVSGWELKNFKKNPLMLWGHDHTEPAVGAAKNIRVEGEGKKARLVFEPIFHDITEKAKAIKRLYTEVIPELGRPLLNSFSVGFQPIEVEGNTYTKQELLEISFVNVPANPDARMLAYKTLKKDGFSDDVIKEVGAIYDTEEAMALADVEQIKSEITELKEQVNIVVNGLKHLNPSVDRKEAIATRLTYAKVVARAADKLLEAKPKGQSASILKVIKRANDKLINDAKQELKNHGKI